MNNEKLIEFATDIAKSSSCISQQVGAVITNANGKIIGIGFNSVPNGPNCNHKSCGEVGVEKGWAKAVDGGYEITNRPEHSEWSSTNEIHAEVAAIGDAAKLGNSTDGSTIYVTISPCSNCSKSLVAAGIKHVVVGKEYDRAQDGWKEWLNLSGIGVDILCPK